MRPVTSWDPSVWHYLDTRDVAWAHRPIFDAGERLPPQDAFLIHAADHRPMDHCRHLMGKYAPEPLRHIAIHLSGRQALSCELPEGLQCIRVQGPLLVDGLVIDQGLNDESIWSAV